MIVAEQILLPIVVFQIPGDDPPRNLLTPIHTDANRRQEWIPVDAIDLRMGVRASDGAADVTGTTAQVEHTERLIAWKWQHCRNQLEITGLLSALLGPPEFKQFVEMLGDPLLDLAIAYRGGLIHR